MVTAAGVFERSAMAASPLDGRLGGTLKSFETLYGAPSAGNPQDGADFVVSGIGVIFVQFAYAPDPDNPGHVGNTSAPDSPATVMNIHPDRAAANAATAPDPADWSLNEAQKRVKKALPVDATISKIEVAAGRATQSCQSAALTRVFTSTVDVGCEISYVLPTAKTVSYVTMALSIGAVSAVSGPTNPCAGALEWSQGAGARLQAAQALLDQVAALSGDDASAVSALHDFAGRLTAIADEQAKATVPLVMSVANDRVVAALRAYAAAVDAAGDGIAKEDAAAVDAAVANLTNANDVIARATAVIQRGLSGCGLEPGTPVAA